MLKFRVFSALLALLAGHCLVARAEEPIRWEIGGAAQVAAHIISHGDTSDASGTTHSQFNLGGLAGFFLTDVLEPELSLSTTVITGGSDRWETTPELGIAFNFGADRPLNAFYVAARAGLSIQRLHGLRDHYVPFAYAFVLGKRFALSSSVTWAPEISFEGLSSGKAEQDDGQIALIGWTAEWNFVPLRLAILF